MGHEPARSQGRAAAKRRSELRALADSLLVFIALYPIVTAALWIAGGVLFLFLRERGEQPELEPGVGPPISVLIPAYNEAVDIGNAVRAALQLDYHDLEVLVLDDGSTDDTAERAADAGGGDPRLRVLRDEVNKGKAERLNSGAREARGTYLMVQDADATVHPLAARVLVARLEEAPHLAAVAGDARVTNRGSLFAALQTLEFAAVIGLIRRTQALTATVGVVAGIIGLFRREALVGVGGYDARMATEDIELTYRLLLGGWETTYEPRALVGMQVPTSMRALWHQRRRWARGQGEVLHAHGPALARWRNRHLWPVLVESLTSLAWITLFAVVLAITAVRVVVGDYSAVFFLLPAWGVAVAVITAIQFGVAMAIERRYDRTAGLAMLACPLYPAAYWLLNATCAVTSQLPAAVFGPRAGRVQWDTARKPLPAGGSGEQQRESEPAATPARPRDGA
jgi:poly-beta-1,6-N-acetyl-D-glucosamine synthase